MITQGRKCVCAFSARSQALHMKGGRQHRQRATVASQKGSIQFFPKQVGVMEGLGTVHGIPGLC